MWNACKQDMFPANAISLRWTQYLSRKNLWINWNYLLKKKALIFQRDTCNLWIDICVEINVSCQVDYVKIMQPPRAFHTEQYCTCLKNGSCFFLEKCHTLLPSGFHKCHLFEMSSDHRKKLITKGTSTYWKGMPFYLQGMLQPLNTQSCWQRLLLSSRFTFTSSSLFFLPNMVSFKDYYFAV